MSCSTDKHVPMVLCHCAIEAKEKRIKKLEGVVATFAFRFGRCEWCGGECEHSDGCIVGEALREQEVGE